MTAARQTRWQVKSEASRRTLVDSAMRCFAERGYAQTRVEDIVEATGYTKGTFYFQFKNKLDCFWAVLAHREALRGDWVAHATAGLGPGTTLEQVLARTFAHFAETEQGVGAWILVMVDFRQQHRDDAGALEKLAPVYAAWHGNIVRYLAALQHAGLVEAGRDTRLLATEAFAYVEGLTAHAHLYDLGPKAVHATLIDGLVALLGR